MGLNIEYAGRIQFLSRAKTLMALDWLVREEWVYMDSGEYYWNSSKASDPMLVGPNFIELNGASVYGAHIMMIRLLGIFCKDIDCNHTMIRGLTCDGIIELYEWNKEKCELESLTVDEIKEEIGCSPSEIVYDSKGEDEDECSFSNFLMWANEWLFEVSTGGSK